MAVMAHCGRTARELAESPGDYAPVLGADADSGEDLWEPWIDGFERAMRLRRGVCRPGRRRRPRRRTTMRLPAFRFAGSTSRPLGSLR